MTAELLNFFPAYERIKHAACLFAVALVALSWPSQPFAAAESVSEQRLKAAFLYNFTKFVEWPAERFSGASDPIVIALLADEALQSEIVSIVANRHVNGRTLVIRSVDSPEDVRGAHIVFVSAREESRFSALTKQASSGAVLTVGDDPGCRSLGGGICFVQQGEKLRFEINMQAVERSQLKISAQLQKLAVAVNRGP